VTGLSRLILPLLFASSALFAEAPATDNQSTPAPQATSESQTPSSTPTTQTETPTPTPATTPSPTATPAPESNEIWSRPEPGHTRGEVAPQGTPIPPPPPYERGRHHHYPDYDSPGGPDTEDSLAEIGVTLGTPTFLNLNFGYWAPQSFPMVVRVSGMYYGDTRGIQLDVGYAFHREANFRQYFALSAVSFQTLTNFYYFFSSNPTASYKENFTGVGPTYGLNWHGLSLSVGLAFGQDLTVQSYPAGYTYVYGGGSSYNPATTTTINQFQPMVLFQLGYTFIW
jgi:hypothetical protein